MRLLEDFLKESGLSDIEEIIKKFYILRDELKSYNKKVNLTSITSDEEIESKHFIDSLKVIRCDINKRDATLLDIGSGAGFPALPIAMVYPQIKVCACESIGKKAEFIRRMVDILDLKNLEVYAKRSEDLPSDLRESFDFVSARAVSKAVPSFELMFPWAKVGGRCFLYASCDVRFDDGKFEKVISILGGSIKDIKEYDYILPLPGGEFLRRKIISATKIKPTPLTYPRRAGMAVRKPII